MKQSHRIIRDVSLVVVFCGGFLALIWFANSLQDTSNAENNSEFSQYRIEADEATQERNIDVSLQNLRSLVAKDPYDGRAQYKLATALFSKIVKVQSEAASSAPLDASASVERASSDDKQSRDGQQESLAAGVPDSTDPSLKENMELLIDEAINE